MELEFKYRTYQFNGKGGLIDIVEDNGKDERVCPLVAQVYAKKKISHVDEMPTELIFKANLFASAPDLLEALLELDRLHTDLGLNLPKEFTLKYQSAIEKALK